MYCTLFPSPWFCPTGFPGKVLMRQHLKHITIPVWLWHPRESVINHIVDVHSRLILRERESVGALERERADFWKP